MSQRASLTQEGPSNDLYFRSYNIIDRFSLPCKPFLPRDSATSIMMKKEERGLPSEGNWPYS
jgi:hypothetical protein